MPGPFERFGSGVSSRPRLHREAEQAPRATRPIAEVTAEGTTARRGLLRGIMGDRRQEVTGTTSAQQVTLRDQVLEREPRVTLRGLLQGNGRMGSTTNVARELDEAAILTYINTRLNRAYIEELEGPFITDGLLAIFNNPESKLKKAIRDIRAYCGDRYANQVEQKLQSISNGALQVTREIRERRTPLSRAARALIGSAAGMFGFKSDDEIVNYWLHNADFQATFERNLSRNLTASIISGVMLACTGTAFWGMVKTPFTIKWVNTPSKQHTFSTLGGGNPFRAFDNAQRKVGERTEIYNRPGEARQLVGPSARYSAALSQELKTVLDQTGFLEFFGKIPLLGLLLDDEQRIVNKMTRLAQIQAGEVPYNEGEKLRLRRELLNTLTGRLAHLQNRKRMGLATRNEIEVELAIQTILQSLRAMDITETLDRSSGLRDRNEGARLEAVLANRRDRLPHEVPENSTTSGAMIALASGRSFFLDGQNRQGNDLAQHIISSPSTPGAIAFLHAFTQLGQEGRSNYLRNYRPSVWRAGSVDVDPRRNNAYSIDISGIIRDPYKVAEHLRSSVNREKMRNIALLYAERLSRGSNGRVVLDPESVLDSLTDGTAVFHEVYRGINTGVNGSGIGAPQQLRNVLTFQGSCTVDNVPRTIELGVKGDCGNLVIGEPVGRVLNNPRAKLPLRFPAWTNFTSGGGSESPGKHEGMSSNPHTGNPVDATGAGGVNAGHLHGIPRVRPVRPFGPGGTNIHF